MSENENALSTDEAAVTAASSLDTGSNQSSVEELASAETIVSTDESTEKAEVSTDPVVELDQNSTEIESNEVIADPVSEVTESEPVQETITKTVEVSNTETVEKTETSEDETTSETVEVTPKRRGRPPKQKVEETETVQDNPTQTETSENTALNTGTDQSTETVQDDLPVSRVVNGYNELYAILLGDKPTMRDITFTNKSSSRHFFEPATGVTINAGESVKVTAIGDALFKKIQANVDSINSLQASTLLTLNAVVTDALSAIVLSQTSATLAVDGTLAITATPMPTTQSLDGLIWSSADESLATVVGTGASAVITAKAVTSSVAIIATLGTITANLGVTIVPKLTAITLSPDPLSINVGSLKQLTATAVPEGALLNTISWASSDAAIATVNSSGLVTAISSGSVTITATSGSISKSVNVTISDVYTAEISPSSLIVNVGSTQQLEITATKNGLAYTASPSYSSSNESVATVNSSGLVTGVSAGTAVITAAETGKYSVEVTANINAVAVTGINLTSESTEVNVSETLQLTEEVLPSNATNKNVTWSSSDENILTVDANGLVTGQNDGTATITATTVDGSFTASIEITANLYPSESLTPSESLNPA